jgi:hypothetical protein
MLEGQFERRRSRQAPTGLTPTQHSKQPHDLLWNYKDNTTGTIKRQQTNTPHTYTHIEKKVAVDSFLTHQFSKSQKRSNVGLGKMKRRVPRRPAMVVVSSFLFVIRNLEKK